MNVSEFVNKWRLNGAVAEAYGWEPEMSDEEILEKLLALNLQRAV